MRRLCAFVCSFLVLLSSVCSSVPARADDLSALPGGAPVHSDSAGLGPVPEAVAGESGLTAAQETAVAEAKRLGAPVEVVAEADERTKVVANPDGTVSADYGVEPFRHLEGSTWVDGFDPVQEPVADRTPGSSGVVVGSVPVAAGKFLDVSWPQALPAKQARDNYAVYPEVRPGVDLVVSYAASGLGTFLVVKTPEAAQGLLADGQWVGARGDGLEVFSDAGGFGVRDVASGERVFGFDPFEMWDASGFDGDPAADVVGLIQSGFQAKRALMDVSYSDGGFRLKPNADMLADPSVQFPLVLDPWFPGSFGAAQKFSVSTRGYRSNDEAMVGYDNYPPRPGQAGLNQVWRSFVSFHLGRTLRGAQVRGARLRMFGTHSPNNACQLRAFASSVQLFRVGAFGAGTRWGNQPGVTSGVLDSNAYGVGNRNLNCPNRELSWGVGSVVQEAANRGERGVYFMLRSSNEGDMNGWRRFGFKFGYPRLTLEFGRAPHIPSQVRIAGVAKQVPEAGSLPRTYVPAGRVQVQGLLTHPDARRMKMVVYVKNSSGEKHFWSGPVNSGEWATAVFDTPPGPSWIMLQAVEDGNEAFWSGKSGGLMRLFPVGGPPTPQVVVNKAAEMGTGTTLTFGAGGTATHVTYLVNGQNPQTVALVNGKATVSWVPGIDGPHTVSAFAQNIVDVRGGSADQVVMARAKNSERKGYWGFDGDLSNKDSANASMQIAGPVFENVVPWDEAAKVLQLSPGATGEATGLIVPPQKTVSLVGSFKPEAIASDCAIAGVRSTAAGAPVYVVWGIHNQRFAGGVLAGTGLVWADDTTSPETGVLREAEIRLDRSAAKLSLWVKGTMVSSVDATVDEITSGAVRVGSMSVGATNLPSCTGGLDWLSVWTNGAPPPTPASAAMSQAKIPASTRQQMANNQTRKSGSGLKGDK